MKFTDEQLLTSAFEGKKQLRNSERNYDRLEKAGIEYAKNYFIGPTNVNVSFYAGHGGITKTWYIGDMKVKKETAIKRYNKQIDQYIKKDCTLRIELESSKIYQNNKNENEYVKVPNFGSVIYKTFKDNAGIEQLLNDIDDPSFIGNYYTYANKISTLF